MAKVCSLARYFLYFLLGIKGTQTLLHLLSSHLLREWELAQYLMSALVGGARGEEVLSLGRKSFKPLVPGDATPLTGAEVSFSR